MKLSSNRKGFTLVETAIALVFAAAIMSYTYSLIANGIIMQRDAKNLNQAVFLTRLKMTQIESGNKISPDHSEGKIPIFKGYSYEIDIKEEDIDLMELAGMKEPPAGIVENGNLETEDRISGYLEKKGKTQQSETGGVIKAFKIKIRINYPSSAGDDSYAIETFKSNE